MKPSSGNRLPALIVAGEHILLVISGGPDSPALLFLLTGLCAEIPFELYLAHFNLQLRVSARNDEQLVRSLAHRLGYFLVVKR